MIDHQNHNDLKDATKRRIGEQLIIDGLIDQEQLQQVLKRQAQVGGQLG